ncbi:MAG: FMN-binding protein, partial [Oscillospiraceae bacterium]|nr:FMN-binding protein [Oscillospiraceae bacterium]
MIAATLSAQCPNVDGVSGATYSSDGLRAAVRAALNQPGDNADCSGHQDASFVLLQRHLRGLKNRSDMRN